MKLNQISLLAHGQFVSVVGDTLFDVALSYWVLELTGSVTIMASVSSLSLVLRIFVSSFAGAIVDMSSKKKIIILCDIFRGISILVLSVFTKFGKTYIWMYFLIMMIIDSAAAFFKPAINSAIALLSEKKDIESANAKMNNSSFIAEICGDVIVSVFFNAVSIPLMFFCDGISYLYSAFTEIFLKIPNNIPKEKAKNNFFKNIKDGYSFVIKSKDFIAFIFFCCVINLFTSMTNIIFLPMFKSIDSFGVKGFSIAMLCFSLGSISCSTLIDKKKLNLENPIREIIISTIICSACMSVLLMCTAKAVVFSAFFMSGFCILARQIILVSAMQRFVDSRYLGVTFSFYSMMLNLVKPLSYSQLTLK